MCLIEIEKKVKLEPHHIQIITQQASLLKETVIQDTYFDTMDYHYTSQNIWLRERQGLFELKRGIKKQNGSIDHYEEIIDPRLILKLLGCNVDAEIARELPLRGFFAFCSFITKRKSFQLDDLRIDLDEADFGDLHYQVAEIEVIVPHQDQELIQEAEQKIERFLRHLEIDTSKPIPAKLSYYLYHRKPAHYAALVFNKIIQSLVVDTK